MVAVRLRSDAVVDCEIEPRCHVAILDDLWLAALTKNEDDAGTPERLNLTINIDGSDVFDRDFSLGPISSQGYQQDLDDGEAGLRRGWPVPAPFESAGLTNSSIRLGLRGDNAWGPRHVVVIARTQPSFTPGPIVTLAMETDIADWLSTDTSEGPLTMPLRLVGPGDGSTVIRRVLLLIYTGGENDADTDNTVQLQIATAAGIVLQHRITSDFRRYHTQWQLVDAAVPFTRAEVAAGSVRLSIIGTDAWLPKMVFVLGLDTDAGRPSQVVTLAAVPDWNLGWLSTDSQEGVPSIDLPLSS